jgi:YfiR/HmsC-like
MQSRELLHFGKAGRLILTLVAALLLALTQEKPMLGQAGLSEDQIKAGFLLNFIRFVEWPEGTYAATSTPVVACIVGDSSMSILLTEAVAGKQVGGHPVHVELTKPTDDLRTCNLVFIGAKDERNASRVLDALKGVSALTVGAFPGFAKSGGMFNFYTEENRVKLEINLDAATHANLKISAKLISVSRLVPTKSAAGGL